MAFTTAIKEKDPLEVVIFKMPRSRKERLFKKYSKHGEVTKILNHLVDLVLQGQVIVVNLK